MEAFQFKEWQKMPAPLCQQMVQFYNAPSTVVTPSNEVLFLRDVESHGCALLIITVLWTLLTVLFSSTSTQTRKEVSGHRLFEGAQ